MVAEYRGYKIELRPTAGLGTLQSILLAQIFQSCDSFRFYRSPSQKERHSTKRNVELIGCLLVNIIDGV